MLLTHHALAQKNRGRSPSFFSPTMFHVMLDKKTGPDLSSYLHRGALHCVRSRLLGSSLLTSRAELPPSGAPFLIEGGLAQAHTKNKVSVEKARPAAYRFLGPLRTQGSTAWAAREDAGLGWGRKPARPIVFVFLFNFQLSCLVLGGLPF